MSGILSLSSRVYIASEFKASATTFGTVASGALIATLTDPFAGQGRGTTTYSTFGSVPGQLAISARQIVAGGTSAVGGQSYSISVLATSGDGRKLKGETFVFRSTIAPPTLNVLALAGLGSLQIGTPANGAVTGATSGSTITVSGVSGLTVDSAARTWSWSGTGTAGNATATIVETLTGATGSPRSTTIPVTIVAAAPVLSALALAGLTSLTIGTTANGAISGATSGSTIAISGVAGLSVNSTNRTWAWSGTGTAGSSTATLTETLSGATGSPKSTSISVTIAAAPSSADTAMPTTATYYDTASEYHSLAFTLPSTASAKGEYIVSAADDANKSFIRFWGDGNGIQVFHVVNGSQSSIADTNVGALVAGDRIKIEVTANDATRNRVRLYVNNLVRFNDNIPKQPTWTKVRHAAEANNIVSPVYRSLSVADPALSITVNAPNPVVGTAYSYTPTTTGGTGSRAYTLIGTLPAGLAFAPVSGTISGTATTSGNTTGLIITVSDGSGTASSGSFPLTVADPPGGTYTTYGDVSSSTAIQTVTARPARAVAGTFTSDGVGRVADFRFAVVDANNYKIVRIVQQADNAFKLRLYHFINSAQQDTGLTNVSITAPALANSKMAVQLTEKNGMEVIQIAADTTETVIYNLTPQGMRAQFGSDFPLSSGMQVAKGAGDRSEALHDVKIGLPATTPKQGPIGIAAGMTKYFETGTKSQSFVLKMGSPTSRVEIRSNYDPATGDYNELIIDGQVLSVNAYRAGGYVTGFNRTWSTTITAGMEITFSGNGEGDQATNYVFLPNGEWVGIGYGTMTAGSTVIEAKSVNSTVTMTAKSGSTPRP